MSPTHTPAPPVNWVGVSPLGRKYEVVSCVLYSIAAVTVVLRVISRLQQFRRLFIDDYMCLVAQFFAFGMMAISIIFTQAFGMGWHIVDMPPAQWEKYFQLFYAAEICYTMVATSYKLAVIFLYQRIFDEVRAFRIASWVMVFMSIGWGTAQTVAVIFQCTPVRRAWDPTTPGHCVNKQSFILGSGICNLLVDALILSLPLPVIWRLQLNWKKKFALTGMFMLGAVICIAGILRVISIVPFDVSDGTYTLYGIAIWSNIELAVGIIAACLPTLRQYFFSSTGLQSAASSKWLSWSRGRSGLNSVLRSNSETALGLSDWKATNIAYAEVEPQNSGTHTPIRQHSISGAKSEV